MPKRVELFVRVAIEELADLGCLAVSGEHRHAHGYIDTVRGEHPALIVAVAEAQGGIEQVDAGGLERLDRGLLADAVAVDAVEAALLGDQLFTDGGELRIVR